MGGPVGGYRERGGAFFGRPCVCVSISAMYLVFTDILFHAFLSYQTSFSVRGWFLVVPLRFAVDIFSFFYGVLRRVFFRLVYSSSIYIYTPWFF